jgi:hypothetical protein
LCPSPVDIVCVWRESPVYTIEYVNKLERAVARHFTRPYRFHIVSDDAGPGWWSKLALFMPGRFTGNTIYLDLDTVIAGNIDWLAETPHDFTMLLEQPGSIPNSCLMAWRGDYSKLWTAYIADPEGVQRRYAEMPYLGDQAFIADQLGEGVGYWPADKVIHFRKEILGGARPYADEPLIYFTYRPKPRDTSHPLVTANWI